MEFDSITALVCRPNVDRADTTGLSDTRHLANLEHIETRLQAWSKRLEFLVAEARAADTHTRDLDRTHLVALQVRHGLLRARVDAFREPFPTAGSWRNFRTAIAHDWSALERGLDELPR